MPEDTTRDSAAVGRSAAVGGALELVRDAYGVPHVFAATDAGAHFGLGYACAQDRFFQMTWGRLTLGGRLAEFLGADSAPGDRLWLLHDLRMRLIGYRRLAQRLAAALDPATHALLQAYADGVNAWVFPASRPGPPLHPLFASLQIPPEPWTVADSILAWMRVARTFTPTEPVHLAGALHQYEDCLAAGHPDCEAQLFPDSVFDEAAAIVQQSDPRRVDAAAAAAWLAQQLPVPLPPHAHFHMAQYAAAPDVSGGTADQAALFRLSQAAAVAGDGAGRPACLLADPRLLIRVPAVFWEAHMRGASFDVRGITVAGSPNFAVGSTGRVAWAATGLGMQQADLFRLDVDPQRPSEYHVAPDGWLPMTTAREVVRVRGGSDHEVRYRESVWGPVVTPSPVDRLPRNLVVPDARPGEEYALRWLPAAHPDLDPHAGFRALYAASDADAFRARLAGWSWPGVHCTFADAAGAVGYSVAGALPLRSALSPLGGGIAQDGGDRAFDWVAIVPQDLLPWVIKDPAPGAARFVYNGNHLPIGAWYPIPLVREGGHSPRSRRLKELLDALPADPDPEADVRLVREDGVWASPRDLARIGLHLRDVQGARGFDAGAPAGQALLVLAAWSDPAGNAGRLRAVTEELAGASLLAVRTGFVPFRPLSGGGSVADWLVRRFGQGDSAVQAFLRTQIARIGADPGVVLEDEVADYVRLSLEAGWNAAIAQEPDPAQWGALYVAQQLHADLSSFSDLEGLPPLAPPVSVGPLRVTFGFTQFAQSGQAHGQWTVLHGPGRVVSETLLPLGQSELPGALHFDSQRPLWEIPHKGVQPFKPVPVTKAQILATPGPGPVQTTPLVYPA